MSMSCGRSANRSLDSWKADGRVVAAVSTAWILWCLLFGSSGLGFFMYGRRQRAVVPLVCGLALMIYPYFVSSTVLLVAIGAALMALPWFVRI